jgi:hypothetical protein
MMGLYTIFNLPIGYFASTTGFILNITTDLKDLIILGFGIAIAFYVLQKIILLIRYSAK